MSEFLPLGGRFSEEVCKICQFILNVPIANNPVRSVESGTVFSLRGNILRRPTLCTLEGAVIFELQVHKDRSICNGLSTLSGEKKRTNQLFETMFLDNLQKN